MSRIIAGSHKGHRLATPPGEATRPTSDRVREAVFGMLALAWSAGVLSGGQVTVPEGATIRDVTGQYIVPGFIDAHDHIADIRRGVRLDRQLSKGACREGYSWGWDRRGVWADKGCRGDFVID